MADLARDLINEISASQADLFPCGPAVLSLIRRIDRLLSDAQPTLASLEEAAKLSGALLELADEMLSAFPYQLVPPCWRRLYTDAALFGVLTELIGVEVGTSVEWTDSVRRLDLALIVAGAPGERREEIVHELIRDVQQNCLRSSDETDVRPTKRARADEGAAVRALSAPHVTSPLRALTDAPSLDEFIASLDAEPAEPFIVKGGCSHWPASDLWDVDYIRTVAGLGRVVPVELGADYTRPGWGQRILPLSQLLDALSNPGETPLYLAQHNIFRQFPALLRDVVVPDYVYACPNPPANYGEYKAPPTEEGYILNGWFGPAGTLSPAHTDPYFNLYAQVRGKKWVWIAPPEAVLDTFGAGPPDERQDRLVGEDEDEVGESAELMTNTARVDVSLPLAEIERRFPAFLREVAPLARQAVLEEGDLLFLPPGWWHAMKSLEQSFSVSVWF